MKLHTRTNTHKHPLTHFPSRHPLLTPPPHKYTQVCPVGGTCNGSVTLSCDDGFYYADHGEVCESAIYAKTTSLDHFSVLNFASKFQHMVNVKICDTIHVYKIQSNCLPCIPKSSTRAWPRTPFHVKEKLHIPLEYMPKLTLPPSHTHTHHACTGGSQSTLVSNVPNWCYMRKQYARW